METFKDGLNVFNIFCSHENILEYFNEFYGLLQNSKCDFEFINMSKFFKCLQYLEHTVFSQISICIKNKFESILCEIFYVLSRKYLSEYPIFDKICEKIIKISILFDTVSLLIKILVTKFNSKISVNHVFFYITDSFHKYSFYHENYSDSVQSEQLQHILKFFVSILRSVNTNDISKYISNKDVIQILNLIPFSNKCVVNVFINHVLPNVCVMSDHVLKNLILELLWKRIVSYFEENSYACKEPYFYSLLCCFSEYISKEPAIFNIQYDVVWKIIQSGLLSDNSYNRKQSIYVFKVLLFGLKTKNTDFIAPCKRRLSLSSLYTTNNFLIWNDLIVLFETLEEKQVHVIKPVLPKLSRILQHSSKCTISDEKSHFLHPSWITCLVRRMISHESKFVVKQGLSTAMNINFNDSQIHELDSEEFIQVLLEGFNDQNMYSRMQENDNLSLFLSSEKILAFLIKYIAAFESENQKVNFLRYLLKLIASKSWCGVALLHLIFALTNLNGLPAWKSDSIMHLRKIIQSSLKTHEPILRKAVEHWLLKCCVIFIDWNSLCLEDISELLFIFKSLERHTVMWNTVVLKIEEIFSTEDSDNLTVHVVQEYCLGCIEKIQRPYTGNNSLKKRDLQKIARLLMILADSSVICSNLQGKSLNWYHLVQPLTSILMDAPKRPYMSQEKFFNVLQFYTILIDASLGNIKNTSDLHTCAIIRYLNCSTEFIEFIYQKSLMDIKESDDIIRFQILFDALSLFSSLENINELFIKLLSSFSVTYDSLPEHFLSKKIIIIFFYKISAGLFNETECYKKLQASSFTKLSYSLLSKITSQHVINDLSKSLFVNESGREVWLKLTAESVCQFWNVTSHIVNCLSSSDLQVLTPALVKQAQSIFDGGSKSTFVSTINCIQTLVPKLDLENVDTIETLLDSVWKACLELHGSETYRPAVSSFIEAVFQPYMLNEKCFDILYKYLDCFRNISENTLGVYYCVIKQFCNAFSLKSLFHVNFDCIPILVHAITYGPIHHKSQKVLEDTITYISSKDEHFCIELKNYSKPSIFVRIIGNIYLLKHLYKDDSESAKIALELINKLLLLDDSTRISKSSKFANSYNHRIRNRIWQTILLLQTNLVTKEENGKFLKRVLDLFEFENQQPSVRYLQEWVVLKILNNHICFFEDFMSVIENSLEKRPGFLVSLLSVLTHLIIHDLIVSENHANRCFPVLINYCMAQNFAVRLYSRLAITKLLLFCEKKNFTDLIQKYDFLHSILLSPQSESALLEKGNVYKNLLKLQEDFYFADFHPVRHFTLETIFYELPRLSCVTSEEWIKPAFFQHLFDSESDFVIPCFNTDDCLKNSIPSSWSDKSVEESVVIDNDSFDYNFQKKISPVRVEDNNCGIDLFLENIPKKNGLIVIASLIDKIPNLGGLCRTCEIFGVNEFVIGSQKYTEDRQFQNLAVSADKWVSIKVIKHYHLKEYLLSLKEEGYTLVGAEQTDDSCKLNDYIFPKKSALLLGNEKEGIPIDLIQLLDACVEIPQQGIIRSLNVHVSGAIFIWEYARQQIKQPT